MTTDQRKVQLGVAVDTTEARAGFGEVKAAAKDMGAGVAQAGQQAAKSLDNLAASSNGVADKFSRSEKQLISSIQRQAAQLEAGAKSGTAYYEALAKQRGVDVNVLRPYLDQLDQLQKKQAAAGVSVGQTTAAFRQLPAQLTDITTQLAGGQSPFLILLQQGGQIKDSFGGIGPTFAALARTINPVTLGLGAMGVALATLAVGATHAETLQRSLNALQAQLEGTGRAGIASSAGLKSMIDLLARSPEVTREGATQVISELTKVHGIGAELFQGLAGAARDYAKATGTDLPTAARTLAAAFADPAKGVKTLDDALGTLTTTQILAIEKLTQQNDVVGAQQALFQALEGTIKGVADRATTPLQRALSDLGNTWSDTMAKFKDTVPLVGANTLLAGSVELIDKYIQALSNPKLFVLSKLGLDTTPPILRSGVGQANSTAQAATGRASSGGATGSFAEPVDRTDDTIKGALKLGSAYQSAAGKAADLADTQKALNAALKLAEGRYGSNSDQAQKLRDQMAGVGEAIASARKKAAGTGAVDAHALALFDVEKIKSANAALVDNYQNAERQLEAMRSAGLIGDADYYTAKRSFIELVDQAQEDALRKENERLLRQTLNTKDGLDRDRKVEENRAQISKLQAKATTDTLVLTLQEKSAIDARTAALLSARQAAQDYFDTTSRGYERDLASVGQGAQQRTRSAGISQIEDRYQQQRQQLQNNRALTELTGPLTDEAKKQYAAQLGLINEFQSKAIISYTSYYDRLTGLQSNWQLGAAAAFADYETLANNTFASTYQLANSVFSGLEDVFVRFATTGKLSFKDLASSFAAELARMEFRAAASQVFKGAGGASGLLSGVLGALGLSGSSASTASASSQYSLPSPGGGLGLTFGGQRALGGPTSASSLYEVGEGGRPELLNVGSRTYLMMGNQGGTVTPAAAGGGSTAAGGNVYIENYGAAVEAKKVPRADGGAPDWRILIRAVHEEIASDYSDRTGPLYHAMQSGG